MNFEKQQILKEIKMYLTTLNNIKIDELMRTNELGTNLDFTEISDELNYIIIPLKKLKYNNLVNLPYELLMQLKICLQEFEISKNEIISFNPQSRNSSDTRSQILNHVKEIVKLIGSLNPIFFYCEKFLDTSNKDDITDEHKKKVILNYDEFVKSIDETKSKIDIKAKEIDDTYKSVQNISPTIGISEHAKIFFDEATNNENEVNKWLRRTVKLACVVVTLLLFSILSLMLLPSIYSDLNQEEMIHFIIAKALLISFFIYATIWSGKNYKSYLHNSIVNKHRSNSLKTFQIFSIGAESKPTKDAVLLKATDAVFSHQNTGFNSGEYDTSSNNPTILEIIKNIVHDSKT